MLTSCLISALRLFCVITTGGMWYQSSQIYLKMPYIQQQPSLLSRKAESMSWYKDPRMHHEEVRRCKDVGNFRCPDIFHDEPLIWPWAARYTLELKSSAPKIGERLKVASL
ncbi:hypothetical protein F5Y01DRAFT_123398 [Xylaria sp. FL0043]|nr:hypothetical protein F5Y01DRAFT_123398 [Xylaria sp. FL0043]